MLFGMLKDFIQGIKGVVFADGVFLFMAEMDVSCHEEFNLV
jgi:hypothetical protein